MPTVAPSNRQYHTAQYNYPETIHQPQPAAWRGSTRAKLDVNRTGDHAPHHPLHGKA